MNIHDINMHIKNKKVLPLYVFTGEDVGLMNRTIEKLSNFFSKTIRCDELIECWEALTQKSIFGSKGSNLYIVRDDKEVVKNEGLWGKFNNICNGCLILIHTQINKSTKFYKAISESVVEFNHLTPKQLTNYIVSNYGNKEIMWEEPAEFLAELCDYDLARVDNELEKLKILDLPVDVGEDIFNILSDLVYSVPEFSVFDFVNGIIKRDVNFVLEELNLLNSGVTPNRIGTLSIIYNRFVVAAKVMSCEWASDVEKITGVPYYQAKSMWSNIGYKKESTLTALRIIQDYESGMKQGRYLEKQAFDSCILEILNLD